MCVWSLRESRFTQPQPVLQSTPMIVKSFRRGRIGGVQSYMLSRRMYQRIGAGVISKASAMRASSLAAPGEIPHRQAGEVLPFWVGFALPGAPNPSTGLINMHGTPLPMSWVTTSALVIVL